MALSHDERMLDRPWLARHAMARHKVDFEKFRLQTLRSFGVILALSEARRLRDAGEDVTEALAKLEAEKAVGDVDPIVTAATHERLNKRIAPNLVDEVYVMRAMRDDRIRRDLHTTFMQSSRWISWGTIVFSVVVAWAGLGWAWDHTDSLRTTYQSAILDYQDAQPKTLRQKGAELLGASKSKVTETKAQLNGAMDRRREAGVQKDVDLINDIKRRRGDATQTQSQ